MTDKKRKSGSSDHDDHLTTCPITRLPIDEKLMKKLKGSANVTKTTLQNTLRNKLGWPDTKVQESWDRDVLIREYYAALMQQKMAGSPEVQLPARSPGSPIATQATSRSAGAAKSAPPPAKGTAKQAKVSNVASSDAIQEEAETSPPPARAAVPAKPPAPTLRRQGSRVHSDTALQQPPRNSKKTQAVKSRDSCFGTTLKLLFVIVVAFFLVIYLVHGFEAGNKKLIAGAQSNMLENYTGLFVSTFEQLIAMVTAFVKPVSDLLAKLTETAVVSAAPPTTKDGLVISAKQAEKEPVVAKPTVTATVKSVDTKNAQQKEAEKAKQYEERRKAAEAAEEQKAAEAAEKQKAEIEAREAREAEAARQRQVEQKRREEEEKKAALERVKKAEEAKKAQEARAKEEAEKEAQQKSRDAQPKNSKPKPAQAQTQATANSQAKKEPAAQQHASPAPPLPPQQQAPPPPPLPTPSQPTFHSDDEVQKIKKEDCEQFDVYDCDVKFPKQFDACRTKKAECDKKSRAKTPTSKATMTTSPIE